MDDKLSIRLADFLTGGYDCIDRIVFNAYFQFGQAPAGFRLWWRQLEGSDDDLDNNHLMRMAGRFSRWISPWGVCFLPGSGRCSAPTG